MKFLTIDASKSINPNTGEAWYRAEVKVSIDDDYEKPEEVFQQLKDRLDNWLPNPFREVSMKEEEKVKDPIQGHIMAINSASNLAALNWHKALVDKEGEKYPALREAFDNKLKQLTK